MIMRFNTTDYLAQSVEDAIQRNISLAAYNTFRFAYRAEYFAVADSIASLKALLAWAKEFKQPVTMIGGGSNLLIAADVSGLVIINRLTGINVREQGGNLVGLTVAAGENWHQLVAFTVTQGWFGIENLALIPGTVGAAPVQNIGAYGVEIKDVLVRVQVINALSGDVYWVNAQDCGLAYRDSYFKGKWKDTLFITAVELSLKKQAALLLTYGGLSERVKGEPSLKAVFDTVCEVRREKLPDPSELANAGSFFKNPIISHAQHAQLKARFPSLVSFPFEKGIKLAAGWLIDQAGWKGKQYQGVGVYEKQALVLVNYSTQSADALLELEAKIKHSVATLYGVELEREPVQLPSPVQADVPNMETQG
ncbi:UDP-N-acetylmuramate dehydrogenase [Marinomonas sp. M1K-6]|uniref:UDP-N-acetylenolpyruvoylglucosamine reductase n=1 Tax=Marinomonas profundi TaxID=2726122 RepID=A0A847R7Q2_9GAMM|nr:UDP-N-acetylmuramate dehydrogenase [Marinomonas profundi]NLQ16300.1 UDP-N-acetylmuramate dehydrogenase [Marinomonas profundi]UDV03124.1 UDP-N-acetylmuramate dehydrogenase [Marinomonas profundi]